MNNLKLLENINKLWRIFSHVAEIPKDEKEIIDFIEIKDICHSILSDCVDCDRCGKEEKNGKTY